jgi:uncharacterized membrane protein
MQTSQLIGVLLVVWTFCTLLWMFHSMNVATRKTHLSIIGIRIGVACGGIVSILLVYLNDLFTG